MNYNDFLEFLSERFGESVDRIKEINSFGELGLDSLSLFSLIQDIEEKYNIELPVDDLTEIDTVEKMYEYILDLKKQ